MEKIYRICKVKGKNKSNFDEHHIKFRSAFKNEKRKVDNFNRNKVLLCPNCHRKIHNNEIIIDRWYRSTEGYLLGVYFQTKDSKLILL